MKIRMILPLVMMMACAHQKTEPVKDATRTTKTLSSHGETKTASRDQKDFAREQAAVMSKKRVAASQLGSVHPQNKRLEFRPQPLLPGQVNERKLTTELQDAYDRDNVLNFQARYQALQSQFPKSAFLPKAHYMAGLMALNEKDYGRALQSFDKILKQSPRSAQAAPAMFAKAITYKRMNLREPADSLLNQVRRTYPNSLEAHRAELELKIATKRVQ